MLPPIVTSSAAFASGRRRAPRFRFSLPGWLLLVSLLLLRVGAGSAEAASLQTPLDLRTEYAVNPLGLDVAKPRMSWKLAGTQRNARQSAYQILVARTADSLRAGRGDLWDSGRVASDQSIQIPYGGPALASREGCAWMVRVWDESGQPTAYSEPATWEMGLLAPADWQAEWIGYPPGWNGRALYFRRDFEVKKEVARARVFVAGVGYHELRLNGAKVGDHVLDPGFTDYAKRVLYATHDITAAVHAGRNTVGAIVGNGWYGMPKLLLQLELTYVDGSRDIVATHSDQPDMNDRWSVSSGPVVFNSVFDGETYDARLEKTGWDQPDATQRRRVPDRREAWAGIMPVEPPGGRLVSQALEPIKVVETVQGAKLTEPAPGVFVLDAGQNVSGWLELHATGAAGTQVTLKYSESLKPDGTVNQENLRSAACIDTYILKGGGAPEVWQPGFTYHGFRYVEIDGYPGQLALESVPIKRVRTAAETNGTFTSSNELLNRIQQMIRNTEANNLFSVPTDCPQRNERMGWMNDLTVRLEESLYNFELSRFYTKFLSDVGDTQSPDGAITDTAPFKWGKRPADPVCASYLLMGWFMYQYYGDTSAMEAHYDGFKAWVDYLARRSEDYVVPYGSWGDWSPPAQESITGSAGSSAVARNTPLPFMSTGYFYYCSDLLAKMARVLGRKDDAAHFEEQARKIADSFQRHFWNPSTHGYVSNNQACNSFALFLGLVPPAEVPRVMENLVGDVEQHQGHLTTGNLCTKYLMETLTDHARGEVAYRIATQKTYPSWGFMLENGATTLWERWELLTQAGMNSHDHPMMGSVSSWYYKYLAGIRGNPAAPGFKKFFLQPNAVEGLTWVRASYRSMYGEIRSEWRRENGTFTLKATVPANTTAEVFIPDAYGASLSESGKAILAEKIRRDGAMRIVEVGSGDYEFVAK